MTLVQRIGAGFQRAANESRAIRTLLNGNAADLATLATTDKSSLLAALNEVHGLIQPPGAAISDSTTTSASTWSSQKTQDSITAAISALVAGAPSAVDTLAELSTAIGNDANFAATITAALGRRVRVDAAQTLTAGEQATARSNIGAQAAAEIGDTDSDFVAVFNTAYGSTS